ncbi:nucleotide exchange factor GrpE [Corynebacterium sp. 320]|uniref:nucleotide exchange factor GrpE n=1 Tax=Corynebacterium TaxID=1716 RepID=UPI00125CB745|nr:MULTISPECIES: nucleotide exchange factor GrpE [Corynebacterium]KAB1503140.1 nucleotide exchange factor GrpE [Corynebacterium sp. 320]KAB1550646.1 nucleotide exchange factor GrpE [Corynebacterium sp. 321]KAB1551008.1 nucleotide exchange factor GrpE [Corynebacterium sp. 319]KAB3526937.1 nucleotide exchange factor GrpE [Corynebacterium sp. 250]KAB3538430.1 nucleotide exchange factor GrpE [Corynebacterium sp. 366]
MADQVNPDGHSDQDDPQIDPQLESDINDALDGVEIGDVDGVEVGQGNPQDPADDQGLTDGQADGHTHGPTDGETAEGLEGTDAAGDQADAQPSPVEAELAERTEDLQRVTAEYTNYRRRVERDRVAVIETAKADVASKLLPILDDLEMAAQHGDLNGPLKAVSDKLNGVFSSINVEAFGAEGEAFDPELHEAVQDLSSGDEKVIGTVLRRGYKLNERVLRNAMVIIADPQ